MSTQRRERVQKDTQTIVSRRIAMLGQRPTGTRRWASMAIAGLVIATGCSDGTSAEEQVCEARAELRDAVDDVQADVEAGEFDDAQDGLSEVRDAYDEFTAAFDDLREDERETLTSQVDALESDIADLQDVQGLDELGSGLDTVLTGAQGVFDDVTETLSCD
jgi:hypothetical protein